MRELLVPTDTLEVEVHTDRRERLRGMLFAAPLVDRGDGHELASLLNDEREYLPLRVVGDDGERRGTLVRKAHLTCVRLVSGSRDDDATTETGPRCHIFLADGESLAGTLDVPAPESHARIIDRLNRADRFIPVTTATGPVFINRTQVVQVV